MTLTRLAFQSLRFYWRTQLGVLLGATLAAAILIGALAVGDSVRHTLELQALARIGKTEFSLVTQDRFFREQLARELAAEMKTQVAPLLVAQATISTPDNKHRANNVQVVGVDKRFFEIGGSSKNPLHDAGSDAIAVNERLADRLGIRVGEPVIVRMEEPSQVSRDAPLSGEANVSTALRAKVIAVASDAQFGRFSLQSNQVPSLTVFVPLKVLQKQLKRPDRANALLVSESSTLADANAALRKHFTLADAGLELRALPGKTFVELRTERVFLDPPIVEAVKQVSGEALGVLTYFVNELRHGEHTAPYSMVTALGSLGGNVAPAALAPLPSDLHDDEIVINQWLADDLAAKDGDEITLKYFVLADQRRLDEKSHAFRVRTVAPMEGAAADPTWMPPFPGISDAENCRDWEPGIPFDNTRIRPKDEDYWKKYRGTPKAFVSLSTGQKLWQNRFGNLTAVRWPAAPESAPALERALMAKIDPAKLGFVFQRVREQALAASSQSMDFGQLFIGFSFFLIVAALLLTAMLFVFNLEQRASETGLLLALGFTPRQVKRALLLEGLGIAVLGAFAGITGGIVYTKFTLHALTTVWRDAVGGTSFVFHIEPATLCIGAASSVLVAMCAMWFAVRGQARRPAAQLLSAGAEIENSGATASGWRASLGLWIGSASVLGAVATIAFAPHGQGEEAAETFFSAGSLLLIGGIAFAQRLFVRMSKTQRLATSLARVGMRGVSRRRGRSLATIGVLASGVFMVIAVSAFRQNPLADARERHSGTGGFALFAQSTLPVYEDLNDPKTRETFGIDERVMKDVSFVPLRVRDGDDASCLNLNRAMQPRVLGVRAEDLEKRGAFEFQSVIDKSPLADGWKLPDSTQADGAVPAIGDEQTVTWALGKKLGDAIDFTDDRGAIFHIRIVGVIAGSILQGSLIVSEKNFIARFPSSSGYRTFLIDAPADRADAVAQELSRALRDKGFEVVPSWKRLADFQAVENTYLAIFQALGGLGLLLGSVGLAIVVLRNVLERRSEFALMQALGFQRRELQRLVLSEHWLLIALGVVIGVMSAIAAVLPSMASPGTNRSFASMAMLVCALAFGGALWTWIAARVALRGQLLDALRNE
jgi:ABC-type antimicrobial peptide transport system permease subunit